MTLQSVQGLWWNPPTWPTQPPATASLGAVNATGSKFAWIGRVFIPDGTTKSITKIGVVFNAVTKGGGSALTLSLQDVSLTTGPIYQPDETQDQTAAVANADGNFVSGGFFKSAALSANRSVAPGELLSVVIEYDGAGRLGADTFQMRGMTVTSSEKMPLASGQGLKVSGSWSISVNAIPFLVLEFTDGTFGTLDNAWPIQSIGSLAFNSGSAADEAALYCPVPVECRVRGFWLNMLAVASADFDVVLYDGTTVKQTVSVDANSLAAVSAARHIFVPFGADVLLGPSAAPYLSLKPTTANNVTIYYADVNHVDHWQASDYHGPIGWGYSTRVDGGAWAGVTNTRRPFAGLRISAIHDFQMRRRSGMLGGMRG